jgi:hypothetical protein
MLKRSLFRDYPFYLSALLFTAIFMIMRLPYFLYYPAVRVAGDSGSYIELAATIRAGLIPDFTIRSPGYPLFIWFFTSVFNRWLAVITAQNLLSLISSLCLIYGVYRFHRLLALPAALAMAGFIGGTQTLHYDSYILSESLYTSCVIFMFAFLFLSFISRHRFWFGFASASMAGVIFVRPAGMYFIVIYIFILSYLLWNKYEKDALAWFSIPLPALLLLLCAYNYLTSSVFAVSTFGEVNLALATISFWEPDPEFPPEVNKALEELPKDLRERVNFTAKARLILENSWDAHELNLIFKKVYPEFTDYAFGAKFETPQRKGYTENRDIVRKVTLTSIKKHPAIYGKFVWVNSIYYFLNINTRFNFYKYHSSTASNYQAVAEHPSADPFANVLAREYINAVAWGGNAKAVSESQLFKSLRLMWQSWQWSIFQQEIWVWAYFIAFGLSAVRLAISRGRHLGAFILFILTTSVIGSVLTVSLVEISLERYAYPTQFIYYLSVALLPLLKLHGNNPGKKLESQ